MRLNVGQSVGRGSVSWPGVGWLKVVRSVSQSVFRSVGWLVGQLGRSVGQTVSQLVSRLVRQSVGRSVGQSVGWSVVRLLRSLTFQSVGREAAKQPHSPVGWS